MLKDGYMEQLLENLLESFSISYVEIGEDLNLVIKLMSGCGKDKYLNEICWKLSIFASKALVSCILLKNNKFLWFSWKHMYLPCFQSKHSSQGLAKGLKMSLFASKMVYFKIPSDLSSFFLWKRLLKGCSELIIVFLLQNLYLYTVRYSHTSPKTNSIFSLPSVSNLSKMFINNFFVNINQ